MNSKTSSPQSITEDLKTWLQHQLASGVSMADAQAAMRASGWDDAIAERAVRQAQEAAGAPAELPPPGTVPEPLLAPGAAVVDVGGRLVRVLMSMRFPRVLVFDGLFDDAECDALVEEARPRLTRSETVDNSTGGSEVNAARTSDGMFFQRGESPLIQRLEQRVAALLRWPIGWGEGLQVLRYRPGAEYRPHHDFFDPRHPGTEAVLKRGGQRVGTLLLYLNTPARGGATTFPDVQLEVAAVKGRAVFFSYDRPHAVTRSLHGGAPVVEGEKWVATKWLRQREFH
jgi:prolyl 4-hydroxylase